MRLSHTGLLILLLLGMLGGFAVGCGEAPPCKASLITLDETRLDAETYEQEEAETAKKVADLEEKLAAKKKAIELIKDKPVKLEEEVNEKKKGSGRE